MKKLLYIMNDGYFFKGIYVNIPEGSLREQIKNCVAMAYGNFGRDKTVDMVVDHHYRANM